MSERETVRESKRRNKLSSCCIRASQRDRKKTQRDRDRRREREKERRERREEETTIDLSTGRSINHSPCS